MRFHICILFLLITTSLLGQTTYKFSLIPFEDNCSYGLAKANGNIVINPKFKKIEELYPGINLFTVTTMKNKQGVLNSEGNLIIPMLYDSIYGLYISADYHLKKDFAIIASDKSKKACYDITGTKVKFRGNLTAYRGFCGNNEYDPLLDQIFISNGKYGLIKNEEIQVRAIYDTIISFGEYFIAKTGNQTGVLTMYGDTVYAFGNYAFQYDKNLSGLIITNQKTNLKGFYAKDYRGVFNIPCRYEKISAILYDRYFLLKESNKCEFYYDYLTGLKFTN